MNLYDKNGYLDFETIYNRPCFVQLITGGRATGKTYGAFKYCIENDLKFLYLRRTNTVVELLSSTENNPLKKLNNDNGWSYEPYTLTKYATGFYKTVVNDKGKAERDGPCIGYMAGLSTFNNIRGFDGSDIEVVLYDEFVPTKTEKKLRGEFEGLMHCYESINRNRDIKEGRPPLKLVCMSNSDDLVNQIYIGFDVVNTVIRMKRKKQEVYENQKTGLGIYLLDCSPISAAKAESPIYKLLGAESEFSRMALGNDFVSSESTLPKIAHKLSELVPVVAIGELCIYKIKGSGRLYASTHISGNPDRFTMTPADAKRFRYNYAWVQICYLNRTIDCESYMAESLLTSVLYDL